jgi:NADH-quinone oxidoreductase subunit J
VRTLDILYFYFFAACALGGSAAVVIAKNPIRGAMGLLLLILSVAALFLQLHAEFLAAIQLIVYAGAIVVLFLFVIMLLGPSATAAHDQRGIAVRTFSGSLFALAGVGAVAMVVRTAGPVRALPRVDVAFGGIEAFGSVLFSDALVPFEVSSALLMVAVIGAIAVARGRQGVHTLSKSERAITQSAPPVDPSGAGHPADTAGAGVFSHEIHADDAKGRTA